MHVFIDNPTNGSGLHSLQNLKNWMLNNPDSSLSKYRHNLQVGCREKGMPEAEIDKLYEELTLNLDYAAASYLSINDHGGLSVTRAVVLFGETFPNTPVWKATLALKLQTDTGSASLFVVTELLVRTLKIDEPTDEVRPVILAQADYADRIAKIIGRSEDGKPWLQRVK